MEDMDGYTGGCVGVMGKAMTEMVIVFFYAVMGVLLYYYDETGKQYYDKDKKPIDNPFVTI